MLGMPVLPITDARLQLAQDFMSATDVYGVDDVRDLDDIRDALRQGYDLDVDSARALLADRDLLAAEVERLRERLAQPVSRWVVVGEADDKALRGWTEGDKQESTVDELTVNPDAWPLGTVIEVYSGASA